MSFSLEKLSQSQMLPGRADSGKHIQIVRAVLKHIYTKYAAYNQDTKRALRQLYLSVLLVPEFDTVWGETGASRQPFSSYERR